jgi:transcription initiation factor TFIID subunit 15
MGKIPAQNKMVSTILLNPAHNDNLDANTAFNVQLRVNNLKAGFFTNATSTYYSAPQDLDGAGIVIGHTHVTIQDLGNSLTPNQPLDASQFVFFKGINDAGDGNGLLQATVTGGLPAGNYRVCTMSGASNHQPVLMPVAQRGTQEDCNKFTVGGAGGGAGGNAGGNNNAGGNQGGNNNGSGSNGNQGNTASNSANAGTKTSSVAATASTSAAAGNGGGRGGGRGGGGRGGGRGGNQNNNAAASPSSAESTAAASAAASSTKAAGGAAGSKASSTSAAAAAASTSAAAAGGAGNGGGKGGNKGGKGGSAAGKAIGGIAAPAVTNSGDSKRPFSVNGNTFVNKSAAVQRACDIQNNACADAVNSGKLSGLSAGDCGAQVSICVGELS